MRSNPDHQVGLTLIGWLGQWWEIHPTADGDLPYNTASSRSRPVNDGVGNQIRLFCLLRLWGEGEIRGRAWFRVDELAPLVEITTNSLRCSRNLATSGSAIGRLSLSHSRHNTPINLVDDCGSDHNTRLS